MALKGESCTILKDHTNVFAHFSSLTSNRGLISEQGCCHSATVSFVFLLRHQKSMSRLLKLFVLCCYHRMSGLVYPSTTLRKYLQIRHLVWGTLILYCTKITLINNTLITLAGILLFNYSKKKIIGIIIKLYFNHFFKFISFNQE